VPQGFPKFGPGGILAFFIEVIFFTLAKLRRAASFNIKLFFTPKKDPHFGLYCTPHSTFKQFLNIGALEPKLKLKNKKKQFWHP